MMNQGQFNELMGELRGLATKLDRIIDLLTQIASQSAQQQTTVSGMDEKALAESIGKVAEQSWIDLLNKTLTPDKPRLRNGPGESMDISRSIQDQAERKSKATKKAK